MPNSTPPSFFDWLKQKKEQLKSVSVSAETDLLWLAKSILGEQWSWGSSIEPSEEQMTELESLVERCLAGEPVAYILGEWEFYGLTLKVGPGVLIPRPETELVVDLALKQYSRGEGLSLADFGSGSGCLALALAKHLEPSSLFAVEPSEQALQILNENVKSHSAACIRILPCRVQDVVDQIQDESLDLIVANPPYIAENDSDVGQWVHKYEPHVALYSENQGLKDIEDWLAVSLKKLKAKGRYYFEIGWKQSEAVTSLLKESDGWNLIEIVKDYSGHPRVVVCEKAES
ncbi:MAG: peptide chain release factor N(5)-glutamine methyltransferase [Bdellovibrionales bacterium]|nr:peptide chain release factor N(5)-glutamine methyltransferase [Bdellovibrionales bacterium]